MPFSPEEIEGKQFISTLRGFDKDEVSMFLRAVAADYRKALERAERAEQQLKQGTTGSLPPAGGDDPNA